MTPAPVATRSVTDGTRRRDAALRDDATDPGPGVDIVVPVHDAERTLVASIDRLRTYLEREFPIPWTVTIVDNASTDATWLLARGLAHAMPGLEALRVDTIGHGDAIRTAWSRSTADVVAYVDVGLTTDLASLYPLIAPLMAGHTGIAVGTRLAPGAHVQRGPERELASRTYNAILHTVLGTTFSDARCGCKALRRDLATILLPMVVDTGRFFDTELLLLAQHNDLRIHEVPVDWADDRDCPADLARTAAADVRGITRLVRTFARGGGRLDRTLIPDGCARSASHVPPIPERIHG